MDMMIGLTPAIVVWLSLVILTEQSLSKCEEGDAEDFTQDVKRYSANMSTVMLHHELSWPRAETNDTVLYTVKFRLLHESCTWYLLFHCQDMTERMCDVDNPSTDYFKYPLDFEFQVTGHLSDSNQTIYATEPIFFNRHRNLTLNAPSVYMSENTSDEVMLHLAVSEAKWKGLDVLDDLKYEIQYWNGGESGSIIHNRTASKITSEMIIMKAKNTWICSRARLHVKVDVLKLEKLDVYSPWSPVNCTDKPVEQAQNFNFLIPVIFIISLIFIILITLSVRNIWGGVCKDLFKKAPLPDAIVKIIFNDDTSIESVRAGTYVTERFEAVDCENNNQSRTTPNSLGRATVNDESIERQNFVTSVVQMNDCLPLHQSNDLTYGIVHQQNLNQECILDDKPHCIDDSPSIVAKFFRYRNYLSSTSTTSTELSPAITEITQEYRFDEHIDGSASGNIVMSGDILPKNNMHFRQNSLTERIHDFDGFNIAYSSNPLRDVPDLLCVEEMLVDD